MINRKQLEGDFPVRLELEETEEYVVVKSLFVYSSWRNRGIGTAVMKEILRAGKPVYLTPSNELGGNKGGLRRFYDRLGFVRNKNRAVPQELVYENDPR